MATYDRTSAHVVYTSRGGCPPIASIASPQSGPDSTAALQAIANLAAPGHPLAGGPLEIVVDQALLVGQISLYSGTTIRGLNQGSFQATAPSSGLWMRAVTNGTDSAILRNANWRSPYLGATIVDQDITIRDLYLDGQRRNAAGGNVSHAQINTAGQFCSPIQIYGCNRLSIENVFVYDPISFHIHCANIFSSTFRRIKVLDPVQFATPLTPGNSRNTDGIHLNGPWSDVTIEDYEGTTGDDFLALNMADGNLDGTITYQSGPQIFKDYTAVYYGSAGTTIVRNLRPNKVCNLLAIIWGSDPANNGVNPSILSYVSIADVAGTTCWGPLNAQPGANFGSGTGGSVTFGLLKDWNVASVGTYPCNGINVPPATNFTVSGFRYNDLVSGSLLHQVKLQGAITGALNVIDHQIYEDSGEASSPNPAILIATSTVAELNVRGLKWSRNTNTATAAVSVTTGTVTDLKLVDTYVNNLNSVVSVGAGGTVGNIETSGLTHTNANSASSFALAAAVARFRAACSNTLSLLSGTAPTSSKTDGTEG